MNRPTLKYKIAAGCLLLLGVGIALFPYLAQTLSATSSADLAASFIEASNATAVSQSTVSIEDDMLGVIEIPKLDLQLPIFSGPTEANLARGIAHVEGTSAEGGGLSTHMVLAGHSGAVTNEWFTNIDRLNEGDSFVIHTRESTYSYQVCEVRIISPSDAQALVIQRDRDLVSLLTCTDSGLERIFVTGERVIS